MRLTHCGRAVADTARVRTGAVSGGYSDAVPPALSAAAADEVSPIPDATD